MWMGLDGPIDHYLFADKNLGVDTLDVSTEFEVYRANLRAAFHSRRQQSMP